MQNVRTAHVCAYHCARTVVLNTAQNSSDYLPSYPPDKHQSSDAVYWRAEGFDATAEFYRPYFRLQIIRRSIVHFFSVANLLALIIIAAFQQAFDFSPLYLSVRKILEFNARLANRSFVVFDFRARWRWRSGLSVRVPEKVNN